MKITFEKRINQVIIFYLFVCVVSYCRYQIISSIGNVILPAEIVLICCALITRDNTKYPIEKALIITYLLFIIYRIVVSYLLIREVNSETRIIIYRELGILLLMEAIIDYRTVKPIIYGIRNIGAINAVLAVVEYITKSNLTNELIKNKRMIFALASEHSNNWRVRTVFMHPIVCAVFLTISWILVLYIPYKNKLMNYLLCMLIIIGMIGTKSRSSWISFILVNFFYIIKKWWITGNKTVDKNSIYGLLFLVLLCLLINLTMPDRVWAIINSIIGRTEEAFNTRNASNYNRIKMIMIGIREWGKFSFKSKILGRGASYALEYLKAHPIKGWKVAVDNTYITTLMNYGALGLGLLVLVIVENIYYFVTSQNKLREMAALVVISIFISGFFYEIHGWLTCTILLSLFCVIASMQDVINGADE